MHTDTQTTARRSFAPREHGAYGQLGAPLVAALVAGRPGAASTLLAAGAVAAFAAQEPLRVALGNRGKRAQREDGARALRLGAALGALALGCGGGAVAVAGAQVRWAIALPAALALVSGWLVSRHQEKSLGGELVAAVTLASVGVPVAMAGGVSAASALGAWASWSLGMAASIFAVRSVIHHARVEQRARRRLLAPSLLGLAGAAAAAAGLWPWWALAGAVPLLGASVGLAAWPPSPKHLRRVGWALVAATVASAAVLARAVG